MVLGRTHLVRGELSDVVQCLQSVWGRAVTSDRIWCAVASADSRTAHAYSREQTSGSLAVKAAWRATEPRKRCTCASPSVNRGLFENMCRYVKIPARVRVYLEAFRLS